jgi:hypothetical protein
MRATLSGRRIRLRWPLKLPLCPLHVRAQSLRAALLAVLPIHIAQKVRGLGSPLPSPALARIAFEALDRLEGGRAN